MNKAMKIFAVGAMLISTTFIQVNAQDAVNKKEQFKKEYASKTPEEKATKFVERLSEKLNLTEAQKKEIYALKLKGINEQKAIHEKQIESRKKSHEDFKKVLTAEQLKTLEELKAQKKEQFKGKKGTHKPYHYKGSKEPAPAPAK